MQLAIVDFDGLADVGGTEGVAVSRAEFAPRERIDQHRLRMVQSLIDQLADDGRLVAVVGERETSQAFIYSRSGAAIAVREVFDASVTALPGLKKKKPAFVF